jgi:hypothetical protein
MPCKPIVFEYNHMTHVGAGYDAKHGKCNDGSQGVGIPIPHEYWRPWSEEMEETEAEITVIETHDTNEAPDDPKTGDMEVVYDPNQLGRPTGEEGDQRKNPDCHIPGPLAGQLRSGFLWEKSLSWGPEPQRLQH